MTAFASALSVGKTMFAVSRCSGSSAPTPHGFQTLTSAQAIVNIVGASDVVTCATSAVDIAGPDDADTAEADVDTLAVCEPAPILRSDPFGWRSVFETPLTRCGVVVSG